MPVVYIERVSRPSIRYTNSKDHNFKHARRQNEALFKKNIFVPNQRKSVPEELDQILAIFGKLEFGTLAFWTVPKLIHQKK